MKIKYVGGLDSKSFMGITFQRLKPTETPEKIAILALQHPGVFLEADAEVPEHVLREREQYADAMENEGKERIKDYTRVLYQAEVLPEETKEQRRKRDAWIKGAKKQIDHGARYVEMAKEWRVKVAKEKEAMAKREKANA